MIARANDRLPALGLTLTLVTALASLGCQAGDHAQSAGDGTTGGPEAAGGSLDDEEIEFEVDDPGATPPEVVDAEKLVNQRLDDARDDLDARALALAKENRRLEELEREIDTRLGNIERLEKRLQTQLGIGKVAHERRDERIAALSELVATMTPQAGADLVAQLGDRDAQWILMSIARKNQRKAAKLMAAMPADRAAQLGQLYLDTDPKSVPRGEGLGPVSPDSELPPSAGGQAAKPGADASAPSPAAPPTASPTPTAEASPPAGAPPDKGPAEGAAKEATSP